MRHIFFICLLKLFVFAPYANSSELSNSILSMRDRAEFIDHITKTRIEQLLPRLMSKHNIDMWIIISREYNEDPVIKTLLPATWISARRTTILVFARKEDQSIGAYAIAPYKVGDVFEKA